MHQALLVVDALLQGNHGLRTADPIDIVYLKDDIFGMGGVPRPDLAEDIELPGGYMGNRYIRYLRQSLQHKLGLMGLLQENPDIGNKGIPQLDIV